MCPPALMACQHQRPELIFCKAGQDQPSTGITCLTGACGFTVKLIIHFKGGGGGGGEGGGEVQTQKHCHNSHKEKLHPLHLWWS